MFDVCRHRSSPSASSLPLVVRRVYPGGDTIRPPIPLGEQGMAVTSLPGAPTMRLSFGRLAAINAFWFGGGAHWQPIYISLIPVGATLITPSNADFSIGRVTAAGGVFALLTPILERWLSDRSVTRWVRRRPWMVPLLILNIDG